jgi:hypothetical protein
MEIQEARCKLRQLLSAVVELASIDSSFTIA